MNVSYHSKSLYQSFIFALSDSRKRWVRNEAKPIRNTPVLYGEDALRFRKEIENLPPAEERCKAREEVRKGAERFRKLLRDLAANG